MNPHDLEALIDTHLQAYADADRTRRSAAVARVWAEDGGLIDPPLAAQGRHEIVVQAETLLSQFPGHSFRRHTAIDAHHGHARYGWQLCNAQGTVVLEGLDVARVGDDGRLQQVVGFFGTLAPR